MIRRLIQQFSGGPAGRRPAARGGRRRGTRSTGGSGARIGAAVERYLRGRR